ncbi:MAG: alpha/beta hydrolase fold domain-containing protein [Clostridiales bacterium]|nr:alpha/beta hydrolase fold domain-containing protein [Clostridiales bacterium]
MNIRKNIPGIRRKTIENLLKLYSKTSFEHGLKLNFIRTADVKISEIKGDKLVEANNLNISNVVVSFITPKKDIKENEVIIYLHGGAYVSGPIKYQVRFIKKIVAKTFIPTYIVKYRKAPEFTYKDALKDVMTIYQYILKKNPNQKITLIGDSAGGGLALSFCLYLKKYNYAQPYKNVLISPWLDVSMSNEKINKQVGKHDVMLGVPGLIEAGKAYSGNTSTKDPLVSPIFGNLKGLPKTLITVGTKELLIHDCRLFKQMAKNQNFELKVSEYVGMFHAFVVAPEVLPEIHEGFMEVVDYINED